MTDDRTLERAARSWLEEGPTRAPDRPVEAALARIEMTPQERVLWAPRRFQLMTMQARLAAAALATAIVVVGGVLVLRPNIGLNAGATAVPTTLPSPSPTQAAIAPTASPQLDWSTLPGKILVEHLGNALDLSEASATDMNPGTRRFYFMDPTDMRSGTVTEFLPGQPATGKSAADISSDGKRVVFQDYTQRSSLYEANLDGTGFHKLPVTCSCQLLYPDYDPTATKVVYVRIEGLESWLEVLDLATGKTSQLAATRGSGTNEVAEQPAWSPDGKTIAYNVINWKSPNEPDLGTVHFGDVPPLSGRIELYDVAKGTLHDILHASQLSPGDVNWSPDSQTLLFTAGPLSTTAGVAADGFVHQNYAVGVDGEGLREIPGNGSPEYFPDGQYILVKVYCEDDLTTFGPCGGRDSFGVMRSDFTDARQVKIGAMDVTDGPQGFAQIGHWVTP